VKAAKRGVVAAVGLIATVLSPVAARAFTLFGSPDFVSPGQAWSLPFTLFGEQVTPRLDIDGFVRYQVLNEQLKNQDSSLMVPEIDLEANLQLTATQRIHAAYFPIDGGFQQPTVYNIRPNTGWDFRYQREGGNPTELWYEGEPLNWLSPNDKYPLDFNFAIGRLPLFFQNGIWFNNIADGFTISKNNIQIGDVSNLNLIYFLTIGETQGGLTPLQAQEERKKVTGFDGDMDWLGYYWEFGFAYSYDNPQTAAFPADLNRGFWAIAATRTFGTEAITLRALGSTGNESQGGGALFVLETAKEFWGVRSYLNAFAGTQNFQTISGGMDAPLANEGILFTPDRLTPTPGLNPSGSNSEGGIFGVIFNPRGHITFTPEFGFVVDNAGDGNDQQALAVQVQFDPSYYLIPGPTVQDVARRGLFYGTLMRLTLGGVRNQNTRVAGERFDHIEKLEMIYLF
jgi:hypothetical protein